jgi:hypothetical protein
MTDMERKHLAEADRHIAKCKAHIARQQTHSADDPVRPIHVMGEGYAGCVGDESSRF